MKKALPLIFAFGILLVPTLSQAQPRHSGHDIPRHCVDQKGKVICERSGCERFCSPPSKARPDRGRPGKGNVGKGHHGPPKMPPPPPSRAELRRAEIQNEMQSLINDNNRLQVRLDQAQREAQRDYGMCLRSHFPHRCRLDSTKTSQLSRDIDRNNRRIDALRRELQSIR
ncbi:MAG: hypothetical protein FWC40_07265 [Proteobacteria bacterium]|nr:hypothetical protein [Pseudomonadota bacterium]